MSNQILIWLGIVAVTLLAIFLKYSWDFLNSTSEKKHRVFEMGKESEMFAASRSDDDEDDEWTIEKDV